MRVGGVRKCRRCGGRQFTELGTEAVEFDDDGVEFVLESGDVCRVFSDLMKDAERPLPKALPSSGNHDDHVGGGVDHARPLVER